MSKSNTLENELLEHIFNNAAITLIGDAAGLQPSAAAGDLFISLHTADPGEAGDQTTNEAAYTNYARQAVARDGTGWTVTSNSVTNDNAITFPESGSGPETLTHFAVGTDVSGTGKLLYSAALDANLEVNSGVTPEFAAGALTVTED